MGILVRDRMVSACPVKTGMSPSLSRTWAASPAACPLSTRADTGFMPAERALSATLGDSAIKSPPSGS